MPPTVAFVRPSVPVRPSRTQRTQRPSVPKFGRKLPHLRCDSHTSFKVKRSKIRVEGGWGHTVSDEPDGHIACFNRTVLWTCFHVLYMFFFKGQKLTLTDSLRCSIKFWNIRYRASWVNECPLTFDHAMNHFLNKKLSCRRETVRRFVSLNILLSHSW